MDINSFTRTIKHQEQITDEVLNFMLEHIGDPDPYVRDTLIYSAWCTLLDEARLTTANKRRILHEVLDRKFLLDGLGRTNDHSVLKRSFTALLLAALLDDSRKTQWMSLEDQKRILKEVCYWLNNEADFRGFNEKLGWIHAFAHGADLLAECVKSEACKSEEVLIVQGILKRILIGDELLLWGEEDRLNLVIIQLFKLRKIKTDGFVEWCKDVQASLNSWQAGKKWSAFLQSLYFKMKFENLLTGAASDYIEYCLRQRYQERNGAL